MDDFYSCILIYFYVRLKVIENLTSKMELNYAIVKYLEGQLYINKLYLYV